MKFKFVLELFKLFDFFINNYNNIYVVLMEYCILLVKVELNVFIFVFRFIYYIKWVCFFFGVKYFLYIIVGVYIIMYIFVLLCMKYLKVVNIGFIYKSFDW